MKNLKPAIAKLAEEHVKPFHRPASSAGPKTDDALASMVKTTPARRGVNIDETGRATNGRATNGRATNGRATNGRATKAVPGRDTKARVHRSDAFEAIHSAAAALRAVGVIDKKLCGNSMRVASPQAMCRVFVTRSASARKCWRATWG